jgi:DNA repair exonuclease SbcCD ATPase subunit
LIVFKTLKYKNFISSGNTFTEYDLNSKKNTLIIGKNGSGKSTLLDALTFALFGKAYRNINKPALVNSVNQKDCVVELQFSIGKNNYKVCRGLKPAVFDIECNHVPFDKSASAKDFQNIFESSILKMNYKSFCSVVILGSRYDSFMQMTPADRRKVVEDVLDIEIFSDMNVLLKGKLSELKTDIKTTNSRIGLVEEKKDLQESNISASLKEREDELKKKQKTLQSIEVEVGVGKKKLDALEEKCGLLVTSINSKKTPIEAKKKQADEIFRDLNKNKNKVKKEIAFYEDHDDCPTCEQAIDETFRDGMISTKSSKAQELQDAIKSLMGTIGTIDEGMDALRTMEKEYAGHRDSRNELSVTIAALKKSRIALNGEIEDIEDSIAESDKGDRAQVLHDIEIELNELEISQMTLSGTKKTHDVAYELLKDSGIKAKIIENYLPIINAQVNKHLQDLDFFVKFEIDETFNETIKSRHLDEFTYASFSEGEKARIDLALLFTWRKIAELKNSVNTNLLILDEVFDGSLDAIGADEVMGKLLFKQSEDTNVFVISHKVDLIDRFENTLKFEKVRGFSSKGDL